MFASATMPSADRSPSRFLPVRAARRCLLLGLALAGGAAAHAGPRVALDGGRVEGATARGVDSFLGLPFAAPPVGELRWRAPRPVRPWSGLRAATAFGPDCMQWPLDYVPGSGYVRPTSEDCLTLNVWRPTGAPAAALPVMVWIYGGAFSMGAGSWPAYRGARLAERNVIVVTFNYRLGRFGFFAHPALSAERREAGHQDPALGNYGLMDQIAALAWVKRNIAAFGGDPARITVFGESAGAASVDALLASPLARGLFAQAISQSGGGQKAFGTLADRTLHAAEQDGLAWTRTLRIADTDLGALRKLPAGVVLGPRNPRVGGRIIVDGRLVPQPVDEAFLKGEIAPVPFIVGANSWEYSLLRWLPGAAEAMLGEMGDGATALLGLYAGPGVSRAQAAARLWGDAFMDGPARFLARRMTAAGGRAYLYRYSYVPQAARGSDPGAQHAAEISLVFRNQRDAPYFKEGAADTPMAETISAAWIRFARTGDPNGPGLPRWPAYDAGHDPAMDFTDRGPVLRTHLDASRFDAIDAIYLKRVGLREPVR